MRPSEPQVLGFDLGKTFAWSRVDDGGMLMAVGLSMPAKEEGTGVVGPALVRLSRHLKPLVDNHQVALIVWESPRFRSGRGGVYIQEMMGVLRLTCEAKKVPYAEVDPSVLKKYATGNGSASKGEMAVQLRLQHPTHEEAVALGHDAVDASWAALWGLTEVLPKLYEMEG